MKFLWIALIVSTTSFAVDPYQIKPSGYSPVCDNSKLELTNLPPIRDQGRYGTCYAHSAMLLLEYQRCSQSPDPRSCYSNKGSVLHLARYHNTKSENKIKIGGDPSSVLFRFRDDRKLATEACAEYEDWKKLDSLYKEERKKLKLPEGEMSESDFFYYISQKIKQNSATQEDLNCWANDLVNAGVNQNVQDLMGILSKAKDYDWQELRYQVLVPKSCMNQMISYPDYTTVSFPRGSEKKTFKGFRDFVFKALSAGVPVEASFKSSEDGYHTVALTGQRHVCDLNKCELQYRIQNSYGKSWQNNYDDGWVNAENLTNLMSEYSLGVSAILPPGKQLNAGLVAPYYVNSPVPSKSSFDSKTRCWKIKEGSQQFVNDDKPRYVPSKPSTPQNHGEKGVWRCVKDGKISFGEYAIEGQECRKIQ